MKKLVYILSVCAVVAAIVIVLVMNKRRTLERTQMVAHDKSAVAVKVMVTEESTYSSQFTSSGVLQARRELAFVSDIAGRIVDIYVDEGSHTHKGQVLIQLDNEMLLADVASSQAAYEGLKKDYERFKSSNELGGITDQQLDNIRTQMVAAESRYTTSKRRLADASIKAPIAGTINKRYVEVGSYLNPGARLFDIIDDSQLKALCYVTEKQVLDIRKGLAVELTSETFPGEVFHGKITFVGDKADRSLNFPVEVTLDHNEKGLKSGMYVSVHFNSEAQKHGILVNRNAISGSVLAANVFIVENGIARKRSVIAGSMVGEQIEILQGLHRGDSVVVGGLINISDGTAVRCIQ